jgi:hypothetical protein
MQQYVHPNCSKPKVNANNTIPQLLYSTILKFKNILNHSSCSNLSNSSIIIEMSDSLICMKYGWFSNPYIVKNFSYFAFFTSPKFYVKLIIPLSCFDFAKLYLFLSSPNNKSISLVTPILEFS